MNDVAHTDAGLAERGRVVAELLLTRGQTMVTAESCTGGWIAKVLTDIPGSSAWFECGVVAYGYEAKEALLGVHPQTLERTGAVSQETVIEMVSGALARYGASVAVGLPAWRVRVAARPTNRWARSGSAGSGAAATRMRKCSTSTATARPCGARPSPRRSMACARFLRTDTAFGGRRWRRCGIICALCRLRC